MDYKLLTDKINNYLDSISAVELAKEYETYSEKMSNASLIISLSDDSVNYDTKNVCIFDQDSYGNDFETQDNNTEYCLAA